MLKVLNFQDFQEKNIQYKEKKQLTSSYIDSGIMNQPNTS